MDAKLKHLELIQAVISRMASNSFALKGWTVLIVSALFALSPGDSKKYYLYLAYLPALAFWILDAYFLRQERLFRKLYDSVRLLPPEQIDFSMNTTPFFTNVSSWFATMFSVTLRVFHLAVLVIITILVFVFR